MFNVGFFPDTIKARSFNLCMVITLLGVYIVILGLIILTLFQGHSCTRNINCKLEVLGFFFSLNVGLLHTFIYYYYYSFAFCDVCDTGVYSREVMKMSFAGQVSGLV